MGFIDNTLKISSMHLDLEMKQHTVHVRCNCVTVTPLLVFNYLYLSHRNCVCILSTVDLCVGITSCCIPVLGSNIPYQLYRNLYASGKMCYAHIISILVALVLPLPGALAPLMDGFLNTQNPPVFCIRHCIDFVYYFTALPLSIIVAVTSCLFALTSWKIVLSMICYWNFMYAPFVLPVNDFRDFLLLH